jgi:pyridoxal phosphate enzyme (YggS family)
MTANDLPGRYAETQTRIASAALRYGRVAGSVGLVAIGKGHGPEAIRALAGLGQRDFGENYLQEAGPKLQELADLGLTWHFTGQIQGNKTRPIAESFAWVHTLDRARIAQRLNEQRPPGAPPINVCLQVRLEDEAGKGGVAPAELAQLALQIREYPRLRLRGLMAIPPHYESFEAQRAGFERLASCMADLNDRGFALDTLSMGMSDDLEAAIAAGATWVRVGTALFGARVRAGGV